MSNVGDTDATIRTADTAQELSVEQVEEHICQAEDLHRSLTEQLRQTDQPTSADSPSSAAGK